MKKLFVFGLMIFLVIPLMADRTYTQTFTTAFSLNASTTKTNGTDFTSSEIKVSEEVGTKAALLTLTFARAAGSSLTVDFYFQVSYDGGISWSDFFEPVNGSESFSIASNHAVLTGTMVRSSFVIYLIGVSHIRLSKVQNKDTANNLTAVNAILSF